jgi:hypothetical protein
MPGLCSATVDIVTPEVLLSSSWFEVKHLSIDSEFITGLTHTDFDFIPDFPLALWRRPHAEQIMPTLPEYLMIFPVFVKFTLLVFYVCGVRVKSCLFVLSLLFLLSLFVQSLYCHIFGTMMFCIIRLVASVFVCRCLYNILLYLDQIALSMFHQ